MFTRVYKLIQTSAFSVVITIIMIIASVIVMSDFTLRFPIGRFRVLEGVNLKAPFFIESLKATVTTEIDNGQL